MSTDLERVDRRDRLDRLYQLLPAFHRARDAEQGRPLQALLRVIAEQVNVVEDDIAQLYENAFIETADDWVVPYLGELVGYRPVAAPGATGAGCEGGQGQGGGNGGCAVCAVCAGTGSSGLARVLAPRREVARLIANRCRKGTLALLEQLAHDSAAWPARAVELFTLLGWAQHLDHPHPARHRVADLRDRDALDRLGGAFESISHSVDLRRLDSRRTAGRFNLPSVAVFVWRLRSYPVSVTPAYCVESAGPHCFSFSVLGHDAPLFVAPQLELDPTHIAGELNLPVPIRRAALHARPGDFVGDVNGSGASTASLSVRVDGWAGLGADQPVPADRIVSADLSDWRYLPALNQIAVDPVLGRLAFAPHQLPKKGVRVSYRCGFSADIGGGEYARPVLDPASEFRLYRIGESEAFQRIAQALAQWQTDQPRHAVIEFAHSGVFVEPISITLADQQTLQLRAAPRARPVLRLIDWQTDLPDALTVTLGRGSRITLDGLLVTGRSVQVRGRDGGEGGESQATAGPDSHPDCAAEVVIRHCTLVPGWGVDCACEPKRPAEPSIELHDVSARLRIEHSIVGAIQIHQDEVRRDPVPLCLSDSIVDATSPTRVAIGAPGGGWAHAALTLRRCTVFGIVDVHAMPLGENSLFSSCVNVARRQIGCMRYCHVPPGCRTPKRYRCQPDGVIAAVRERGGAASGAASEIANEILRVTPQFSARRYGQPAYAQLALTCAAEIRAGADDDAEMGVFHDLFQPQREANLRTRLAEFTPAGMHVGISFAT